MFQNWHSGKREALLTASIWLLLCLALVSVGKESIKPQFFMRIWPSVDFLVLIPSDLIDIVSLLCYLPTLRLLKNDSWLVNCTWTGRTMNSCWKAIPLAPLNVVTMHLGMFLRSLQVMYLEFLQEIWLLELLSQGSSSPEPREAKENSSWLALRTPAETTGRTTTTPEGWLGLPCWQVCLGSYE